MEKSSVQKALPWLLAWLVLNLIQAFLTELLHDEAYYWVFSRKPALAYFDQMPAIGFFIRVGYSLIPNEAGVRLITVLLNPITLYIYYKLSQESNGKYFLFLGLGMLAVHFNGFFTSADAALSFTLACFLLSYKKYLDVQSVKNALLLMVTAAAVAYSKYQGILFIILLVVHQLWLWKKPIFWLAVGGAILLSLPIYFADPLTVRETLNYHLSERGSNEYSIEITLNFLISQLVILGPLMGPFLVWAWIRFKPKEQFFISIRNASFLYFGFLVLLTFKTGVEANWSAPILGCILIVAAKYYSEIPGSFKWIRAASLVSFSGIVLMRIYLIWDFLPAEYSNRMRPETHGWKQWASVVQAISGDEPVVFWNTYQLPAKFWFYSGKPSTCVSNFAYRKNQFNLMSMEQDWQGKSVWLAAGFPHTTGEITLRMPGGKTLYMARVDRFFSYPKIRIEATVPTEGIRRGETIQVPIVIYKPEGDVIKFDSPLGNQVTIGYSFVKSDGSAVNRSDTTNLQGHVLMDDLRMTLPAAVPDVPGEYDLYLYINTFNYSFSDNGPCIPVTIR